MSKEMSVIALGLWVIVMPYLGIYRSWLTVLLVLTGLALMLIGFLLRGEKLGEEQKEHTTKRVSHRKSRMPFEENTAVVEQDYSAHHQVGSLN